MKKNAADERIGIGQNTPRSGHNALFESLQSFDPDSFDGPIVSLSVAVERSKQSVPMHAHMRGQLTLARRGSVVCELESGIWLIPPDSALWIPGGIMHKTSVDADSTVSYIYVDQALVEMPKAPGTLQLTPLVCELIHHMAAVPPNYPADGPDCRIASVLVEQLSFLPFERFYLLMPRNERLRQIVEEIMANPGNRNTIDQWANRLALSEKSLRRLIMRETGLTFGQWRQQFHLTAAIRELSQGRSVEAVAALLGYKSASAFTLMFKRSLGKAPKEYMRHRSAHQERLQG